MSFYDDKFGRRYYPLLVNHYSSSVGNNPDRYSYKRQPCGCDLLIRPKSAICGMGKRTPSVNFQ